jgi:starch synthase (maltosyl-transferring)
MSGTSPSRNRNGTSFHVNGITVNKTTQTVESASGAFHIEGRLPADRWRPLPVKRIVGERVDVWADIYRDGHDVVARRAGVAA